VVPAIPPAAAPTQKPAGWVSGILAPAISSWAVQSVRWLRAPERRTELRTAFSRSWSFVCRTSSASATYLNSGWQRLAQTTRTQARRLEERRQSVKASRTKRVAERASWALTPDAESALGHQVEMITRVDVPDIDAIAEPMRDIGPITIDVAGAAHLSDGRVLRNDFASAPDRTIGTIRQPDEPAAPYREAPFELRPLPWVLGALSPVISSRTLMMHHGSHYAQCVESANRLMRGYEELTGKSALEIVRWASEHARGTELATTTAEVWNHWFFWQCLTPWKKRPSGELSKALDRTYGDFNTFAEKFALAGATHVGSGWLWLVANRRKQVKILTTSGAECPEARGRTCLLAIDLWEHAYYLDHQHRRREYLDALIDRRLNWAFAESRYRLVLERETQAPRTATLQRQPGHRSKQRKRVRKAAAHRQTLPPESRASSRTAATTVLPTTDATGVTHSPAHARSLSKPQRPPRSQPRRDSSAATARKSAAAGTVVASRPRRAARGSSARSRV
jgi:Fe-Mn family superoxide dismutase